MAKAIDEKYLVGLTFQTSDSSRKPVLRDLTPSDVLSWRDAGESRIIVTADGQKRNVAKETAGAPGFKAGDDIKGKPPVVKPEGKTAVAGGKGKTPAAGGKGKSPAAGGKGKKAAPGAPAETQALMSMQAGDAHEETRAQELMNGSDPAGPVEGGSAA